MLKDPGSSESKRLLAFQELSCSDMPNIRTMTLDAGFASSNKILQSEALTTLLMQRDQIRIELFEDARTNSGGKQFIQSHSGSLPYIFYERDRVRNCINLHQGEKDCTRGALTIDGLNVRLKDLDWTGTFALQPERILKGTIIHTNQLIGAKIDLTQ